MEMCRFFKRNRYVLGLMGAVVFLMHGERVHSLGIGIDTEAIIYSGQEQYEGWLSIGRQGLVLLKYVLGTAWYNPYFVGILTCLLLGMACIGFLFLFEYVLTGQGCKADRTVHRWLGAAFGLIVVAHPVLTEQLYFTLQSAEVMLAVLLLEVCLLCAHLWAKSKNIFWALPAVVLLPVCFSVYQAMVPLYLFGVAALLCLRAIRPVKGKSELLYMLRHGALFLAGFGLNMLITRLFFTGSDYLSDQINWGKENVPECVTRILGHMWDVAIGEGTFYFQGFLWLCLLLLALAPLFVGREVGGRKNLWLPVPLAALVLSPFYLTMVQGIRPVPRAQLSLPFATAFLAYLVGILGAEKVHASQAAKVLKKAVGIGLLVTVVILVGQEAGITQRMYYTDALRYEQDAALAYHIQTDIQEFTGQDSFEGPVVFLGRREARLNDVCVTGDVMGQSLFAWDTDAEPVYYWSSGRIVGFLHTVGARYAKPEAAQVQAAVDKGAQMPVYPARGSIAWCGETLVVKLSEE